MAAGDFARVSKERILEAGEAMRHRKALIRHYEFTAHYDEADYPHD